MESNLYRLLYLRMIGKSKEEMETSLLDPTDSEKDNGEFLFCPDIGFCFDDL